MLDVKVGDPVVGFDPYSPALRNYKIGTVEVVHKTQFVAVFGNGATRRRFKLSDGLEIDPIMQGARVKLMTDEVKAEMASVDRAIRAKELLSTTGDAVAAAFGQGSNRDLMRVRLATAATPESMAALEALCAEASALAAKLNALCEKSAG